jgi:hypothetical protein
MKRLLNKLMLVIILLNASISNEAMARETLPVSRRIAAACTAILATTAVSLTTGYAMTGKLHNSGFGTRVVWSSNRRAIVAVLARALGIKGGSGQSDLKGSVEVETRGFDPEYFKGITYEELLQNVTLMDVSESYAKGYVIIHNRVTYFKLTRDSETEGRYVITSSLP